MGMGMGMGMGITVSHVAREQQGRVKLDSPRPMPSWALTPMQWTGILGSQAWVRKVGAHAVMPSCRHAHHGGRGAKDIGRAFAASPTGYSRAQGGLSGL
ncbi:uncharacterized protein UV8b_04655 [Ustilaginoidea virens]|uniref:Uncharacterized protein n=1 Tax=Ustilaginoidea virens TaxID=1159556 RepID=A0A8E5HSL3_USTVR|nr:uncharacterized protein UV8b_04655 [Ustilaginoidea virens]QUC20414.1 hypothetical protein UV8b_04655 [Ustilaginoidea virens]